MEEKYGEAISIAKSEDEKEKILKKYIHGKSEPITSKLAVEPILRSNILGLIATGFIDKEETLFDFFNSTLYGFQFKNDAALRNKLLNILKKLEKYEFIKISKEIKPTLIGKRIAELYLDPESAWILINGLKNGTSNMSAFSLLQLICNTIEMEPIPVRGSEWDEIQLKLIKYENQLLIPKPSEWDPEYEFFISSVKTAFILEDWINEKSEEHILEKYNLRPGALYTKLQNADWLLYSCQELARILNLKQLQVPIRKTRLRVKYGIRERLIPLVKLKDIGRVRARKLFNLGVKDLADLKKIDVNLLAYTFGKNLAISLKKQVGIIIDPNKIGDKKRKGQQELSSF